MYAYPGTQLDGAHQAEYHGLIEGLKAAERNGIRRLEVNERSSFYWHPITPQLTLDGNIDYVVLNGIGVPVLLIGQR